MFPNFLLPDTLALQGETLHVDEGKTHLVLCVRSVQCAMACPGCQHPSERVHSRYIRTLADLPCADLPVKLHLTVRRFFCTNAHCSQAIFSERLPEVADPWARRTRRLAEVQTQLGLTVGSKVGERLGTLLHLAAGDDVLLRLMRKTVPTPLPTPRVLGVD